MEIDFPNTVIPKLTAMGTISFQTRVDGEYLWCEISVEALRDHFGAKRMAEDVLLLAFHHARARIEETARRHLASNGGRAVMLMSCDF